MINYELKAQLLSTDLPLYQRKISKYQYLIDMISSKLNGRQFWLSKEDLDFIESCRMKINLLSMKMRQEYGFNFNERNDLWQECAKINKAYYQRVKRLKTKISGMIQDSCVFVTLTFSDKYINSSTDTKRKYVQRFFNDLGCEYVANIDYGKKNGRVHFHGLAKIERIDANMWQYGNIDFKSVYNQNDVAISKYICKLTNHAIKNTTKGNRLLYDKK